ncbi:MAG: lactate racemase domain-containing protein [Planctomycetota bacterium JB042]
MTELRFAYGAGEVALRVPDRRLAGFHSVRPAAVRPVEEVRSDLEDRLRSSGLPLCARGARVALLVPDATRKLPHADLVSAGLAALSRAARVTVVVATGTHATNHPDNVDLAAGLRAAFARRGADPAVEVHVHDAKGPHVEKGTTSRGTPVLVDRVVDEHDVLVAISDLKPHYFAGYSHPVKNLVPGVAGVDTVRANHALALDEGSTFARHPWHPDPARRSQPLAEDLVEAFELAWGERPAFAVGVVSVDGGFAHADAGPLREVTERGMAAVDRLTEVVVPPAGIVVVSCGGAPSDESLYTAQRALELTGAAFEEGGRVLFLAECRHGIGPPGAKGPFYDRLRAPLDEVLAPRDEPYVLYAHKAVKLARMLKSLDALALRSALPDDAVSAIHLEPTDAPQATLDRWLVERPDARVLAFDQANRLAVRRG